MQFLSSKKFQSYSFLSKILLHPLLSIPLETFLPQQIKPSKSLGNLSMVGLHSITYLQWKVIISSLLNTLRTAAGVSLPSWVAPGGVQLWAHALIQLELLGCCVLHHEPSRHQLTKTGTMGRNQGCKCKLNDKCLGVIFLSHYSVSTVCCSAGLKIHQGGMGGILH